MKNLNRRSCIQLVANLFKDSFVGIRIDLVGVGLLLFGLLGIMQVMRERENNKKKIDCTAEDSIMYFSGRAYFSQRSIYLIY